MIGVQVAGWHEAPGGRVVFHRLGNRVLRHQKIGR